MALSPPLTLEQIYDTIRVYPNDGINLNVPYPDDTQRVKPSAITVRQFLTAPPIGSVSLGISNKQFILVDLDNQILATSIQTPYNIVVECNNQTPNEFQENYRPFILPDREFMFLRLSTAHMPNTQRLIMIIKPEWLTAEVPGTKFFRLRFVRHINKYITSYILHNPDWNPRPENHELPQSPQCNQRVQTPLYELVPMTVDDINNIPYKVVFRGGKSKRRKKNRKSIKNKRLQK